MKKAINLNFGDVNKIEIVDVSIPKENHNEVLVKVQAAALNPKDILIRKGKFKKLTGNKFPQGIGFDFSGIIENSNYSMFKKGDKVFGMLNGWKGRSCAEYLNINKEELYLMPEERTFEECAGIPLAGQTALQGLRNIGKIKKGDKVIINGASGGVGTLAIQIGKTFGAHVTTISSSKNIQLCKSLGANKMISYEELEISELENRYDIFFDVFGNYSFKKTAFLLTKNGVYVTTVPKPEIFKEQFLNVFRKQKARMVYVKSIKKDLKWLREKINNSELKPLIDKVFALDEIRVAQKYIESKRAKGKVILKINTTPNKL